MPLPPLATARKRPFQVLECDEPGDNIRAVTCVQPAGKAEEREEKRRRRGGTEREQEVANPPAVEPENSANKEFEGKHEQAGERETKKKNRQRERRGKRALWVFKRCLVCCLEGLRKICLKRTCHVHL